MTWTEIKIDGYDFCVMSDGGTYEVKRKGEQVGLWYLGHRIGWYGDVEDAMFTAWILNLKGERKKWKMLSIISD